MLQEITLDNWTELSSGFQEKTIFHSYEWFQILKEGFPNLEIKLYAIIDNERKIIGLLPIECARIGPLKLGGSPLPRYFTPYQGPLLMSYSDNCSKMFEEMADLVFRKLKVHYFTLSFPPHNHAEVHARQASHQLWETKKTLLLDLSVGVDKLWKGLKSETRNEVRQAERRGVEIIEAHTLDEWLGDYYLMHRSVYSRQGVKSPGNPCFYRALWNWLYSKGQLKVALAKHQSKLIAGGIFLIYKDTIYFLDGASFREHQKLRGNNLIQWNVISWAASSGLCLYDMVGANIPTIAHFKRGFGAVEVEHSYLQRTGGFLGKVGYTLYQKYRPIWKKLGL